MKKILFILTIVILLIAGYVFANNNLKEEEKELTKIKVVTTIFPYYDFTRQLSDDNVEITMLLKPGVDMHNYDPTAEDIINMLSSDIFIYTGGHSDVWLEEIIDSIDPDKTKVIRLFDYVDFVKEEEILGATSDDDRDHHDHDHEEDAEYDEHIWTSIPNAKIILEVIKDALVEYRISFDEDYSLIEDNYNEYVVLMDELDEEIREVVASSATKYLLFGDRFAFRYFTDEYNLSYSAAFTGCSTVTEPSLRTMTFLTKRIKDSGVPAILHLEGSSKKVAESLSLETKVPILEFNSMQNITKNDFENNETYITIMKRNIEVLRSAL